MRIFRVCPTPGHTEEFRKLHGLRHKSFDEQIRILRDENLLVPGGWAAGMAAEGFEVFETSFSDSGLQARWAQENGLANIVLNPDYLFRILKAQVKKFQPDVLLLYAGAFYWLPRRLREELRSAAPSISIMSGFWGDELPPNNTYSAYFGDLDIVFCSSSVYQKHLEDAGLPAVTIGNCFDDTIAHAAPAQKSKDFIFCGTSGFGYPDHIGRYEKLVELMSRSKLEVWTNEPRIGSTREVVKFAAVNGAAQLPMPVLHLIRMVGGRTAQLANLGMLLKQTELDAASAFRPIIHPQERYYDHRKPLKKLFPSRVKPQLSNGTDYYALLAKSKLVLNLHRDEDADIGNIRCFEVAGVGSCLVTDRGEELREFFDVDNDIVTFESVDECLEKVNYLLAHPGEIERIAKNGQRTVMARHTVAHRCKAIASALNAICVNPVAGKRKIVLATYDLERHPISYDVAFFLQAAEIYRKQTRAQGVLVNIVHPADVKVMAGVPKEADAVVDSHARQFRIFHICAQMVELIPSMGVLNLKDRSVRDLLREDHGVEILRYPDPGVTHHSEYYRTVNGNPELLTGFSASVEAHRFIKAWLDPIRNGKKVLCITLRQYHVDKQRNSNIDEWRSFLERVDKDEYAIVIVPDTDHIADYKSSALGRYPAFEPACFDVDLRTALYESATLNMFVNTGPAVAATLNKKVNYLLFKILAPGVPHTSAEFLEWNGYVIGASPRYATPFQKWVWEEDTVEILWREFRLMCDKLEGKQRGTSRDTAVLKEVAQAAAGKA